MNRRSFIGGLGSSIFALAGSAPFAQQPPSPKQSALPAPVTMTAQQDHQRTMELLKITSLRRGADGRNADAPNAANYDESKANPYPNLPDPLVLKNGKKVTSAKMWWKRAARGDHGGFRQRNLWPGPQTDTQSEVGSS